MTSCPRCLASDERDVELVPGFGALLEDVCPSCHGRFLGPAAVERVVVEELGLSADMLREMTALFTSKTRLPCPSCSSKLSPLELRKVRIDLCTGCGGAWLDVGELTSLGQGRHEELSPAPAADVADAAIIGILEPETPLPGGFVVFFDAPTQVTREALTAAFAKVPGLASPDAAQIVSRKRCTAIEGVTEQHARGVVATLAGEGIGAQVADDRWLSLPPPMPTSALAVEELGIVLGRMADQNGRVEVPWSAMAAMATGQVVRSSIKRSLSARQTQERVNEPEHELTIVEAPDVCLEIVVTSPARRYRLMLSTMIFGDSGRPRPILYAERLTEIVRRAPATLALGRGIAAAIEGGALPRYASMRDLERELGWLLWRRA